MLDSIGQSVAQSLGVDIANLTTRLAVAQAVINEFIDIGNSFDMSQWHHEPLPHDDGSPSAGYVTTIPGMEADKIQRLLLLLQRLQGPAPQIQQV